MKRLSSPLTVSALMILAAPSAFAQTQKAPDPSSPAAQGPKDTALPEVVDESVDIDAIKEKYWARGDQSELGVVQNRIYTKAKKLQLGVIGGVNFGDPFLSVQGAGLSLGYHFNDLFGVELMALKYFVGDSNAYTTFKEEKEGVLNTNPQKYFLGLSGLGSFLYGKLSFFGKKIIYYDMYVTAGAGLTGTQNGGKLTGSAGIGQRFYLSQAVSFRFEYKLNLYSDNLVELITTNKIGTGIGTRTAFNHHILIGFDMLFDLSKKAAAAPKKPEVKKPEPVKVDTSKTSDQLKKKKR